MSSLEERNVGRTSEESESSAVGHGYMSARREWSAERKPALAGYYTTFRPRTDARGKLHRVGVPPFSCTFR
jgi:hypothetical protein